MSGRQTLDWTTQWGKYTSWYVPWVQGEFRNLTARNLSSGSVEFGIGTARPRSLNQSKKMCPKANRHWRGAHSTGISSLRRKIARPARKYPSTEDNIL